MEFPITTKAQVIAVLGRTLPGKTNLNDVSIIRAYLRHALSRAQYEPGAVIDYGSIVVDADEDGFIVSPNAKDEAFTAAAHLEGLIPAVHRGFIKASGVLWPGAH